MPDNIPDYPERNHGLTREDVTEQVRAGLIRYLEANRSVMLADMAIHCGYKPKTLYNFIEGENDSILLAQSLVLNYLEIGAGLSCVCDCCGRIPHFSQCR